MAMQGESGAGLAVSGLESLQTSPARDSPFSYDDPRQDAKKEDRAQVCDPDQRDKPTGSAGDQDPARQSDGTDQRNEYGRAVSSRATTLYGCQNERYETHHWEEQA